MLTKTLAAGLLATACFCAPAMAQSTNNNTNTTNPPAAVQPGTPAGQAPAGTSAGMGNEKFYTNTAGGEWRASKFKGIDIYGPNNQKIGDVRELIMDHSGMVKAVVVGVGGFLGIGEKDVAIPFNEVQWTYRNNTMANNANTNAANSGNTMASNNAAATNPPPKNTTAANTSANTGDVTGTVASDRAYPDRGVVNMTKDELKNAPTYRYPDERKNAD